MRWFLILLVACGGSDPASPDASGGGGDGGGTDAAAVNPLDGIGDVELVQDGFMFTEGPQWREAEGDLVFTDIPASTVYVLQGAGPATVLRNPSGNANGLAIDGNGAVIAAQHNTHSITRDGVEIISTFESKRLNSPNDVIVADDGTIYFTDPPYGLDIETQQGFNGVYRIAPDTTLTAEYRGDFDNERPNGIGLSLDGKTLYVSDTMDGKIWGFPIDGTGALGTRTMVAQTSGGADGLAIDSAGNIFATSNDGIEVFAPDGTRWGAIAVPKKPANCAFGDADHRTLYITANDSAGALYKVRLANPGEPRH
ncbi:MAG TPA: SMP-30/gluconolactonase/LRE family protein [Kofleriaceae bacterium]|nr:SMP-30/gluconolactonase/LRE family protein [Kofleriaceae bacterium]